MYPPCIARTSVDVCGLRAEARSWGRSEARRLVSASEIGQLRERSQDTLLGLVVGVQARVEMFERLLGGGGSFCRCACRHPAHGWA